MDVNKAIIIGNVGRDPEIRTTNGGKKIANFSIATSRKYNSGGEAKEITNWHRVVVMNEHLVKIVEAMVGKGTRVYVEGEIQHRDWEDKEGKKRSTTEIVLSYNGVLAIQGRGKRSDDSEATEGKTGDAAKDFDDEIPF